MSSSEPAAAPAGDGQVTLSQVCRLVLALRLTVLGIGALSVADPWLLVSLAGWAVATAALLFGWSRDDRPFLTRPVGLAFDLAGLVVVLLATGHDPALVAAGYTVSVLAGLVLRWRGALVGATAIALAVALAAWLRPVGGPPGVGVTQEVALVAAFAAVGAVMRHTLDEQAAAARRHLVSRAAASAAAEREELGRRLHDDLAKDLVAVQLLAEELRSVLREGEPGALDLADRVVAASAAAVVSSRRLVRRQRSGVRLTSLPELLAQVTDRWASESRIRADRAIDAGADMSVSAASAFEAVLREALDNVRRHARAEQVTVRLYPTPDAVVLEVRDDGIGFPRSARMSELVSRGSFGVLGMQERMAAVGGRLEVLAVPGGGTLVRAVAPAAELGPGPGSVPVTREEVPQCGSSWPTTTPSYERAS